jgi:hypothetical protein
MARLKVGDVLPVPVEREHIDKSAPCNKDSCMLSEGLVIISLRNLVQIRITRSKAPTTRPAQIRHVQTHRLGVRNLSNSSARTKGLINQCDERRTKGLRLMGKIANAATASARKILLLWLKSGSSQPPRGNAPIPNVGVGFLLGARGERSPA